MTATINGISVSGTVEEINELISLNASNKNIISRFTQQPIESTTKVTTIRYCSRGRNNKESCEYYKKGYCTCSMYSYPPQYEKCSFESSDIPKYKYCREVDWV